MLTPMRCTTDNGGKYPPFYISTRKSGRMARCALACARLVRRARRIPKANVPFARYVRGKVDPRPRRP